jgi:hypothetical protein
LTAQLLRPGSCLLGAADLLEPLVCTRRGETVQRCEGEDLFADRKALPLRHLNDGMLDVMVRGQGPVAALAPMGILLGFAVVVTRVAVRLFRWDGD